MTISSKNQQKTNEKNSEENRKEIKTKDNYNNLSCKELFRWVLNVANGDTENADGVYTMDQSSAETSDNLVNDALCLSKYEYSVENPFYKYENEEELNFYLQQAKKGEMQQKILEAQSHCLQGNFLEAIDILYEIEKNTSVEVVRQAISKVIFAVLNELAHSHSNEIDFAYSSLDRLGIKEIAKNMHEIDSRLLDDDYIEKTGKESREEILRIITNVQEKKLLNTADFLGMLTIIEDKFSEINSKSSNKEYRDTEFEISVIRELLLKKQLVDSLGNNDIDISTHIEDILLKIPDKNTDALRITEELIGARKNLSLISIQQRKTKKAVGLLNSCLQIYKEDVDKVDLNYALIIAYMHSGRKFAKLEDKLLVPWKEIAKILNIDEENIIQEILDLDINKHQNKLPAEKLITLKILAIKYVLFRDRDSEILENPYKYPEGPVHMVIDNHSGEMKDLYEKGDILREDYVDICLDIAGYYSEKTYDQTSMGAYQGLANKTVNEPEDSVLSQMIHERCQNQVCKMLKRIRKEKGRDDKATTTDLALSWELSKGGDENDGAGSEEIAKHIRRVGGYAEIIALGLGYSGENARLINLITRPHDAGKGYVLSGIRNKEGRLTEDEFEAIKEHSEEGYNRINRSQPEKESLHWHAAQRALGHHEKWDGTGYPKGLKEEEIHLLDRILSIADVFDATTSERCYKSAWQTSRALSYVLENANSHFDSRIVATFIMNFKQILKKRLGDDNQDISKRDQEIINFLESKNILNTENISINQFLSEKKISIDQFLNYAKENLRDFCDKDNYHNYFITERSRIIPE